MKSVLVIEGDAMVRRFLRAALEAVNYSVVEAVNDADGLRMASRADIGVIVLDCMGSNAGGLRTLKKLRTEPGTASIPALAMSGLGQYGYDLPMWANACLVKPFRANQLIRKIQEVAGSERQAVPQNET